MSLDEYIARLDAAFLEQKKNALRFIEHYNANLPTDHCPICQCSGHVPGLPCPECAYVHSPSYGILRSTEWGWSVVAIDAPRKNIIIKFEVDNDL